MIFVKAYNKNNHSVLRAIPLFRRYFCSSTYFIKTCYENFKENVSLVGNGSPRKESDIHLLSYNQTVAVRRNSRISDLIVLFLKT